MSLQLVILTILKSAVPYPLSFDTIRAEVQLRGRKETTGEVDDALRELDGSGDADGITNADAPGGSKWAITDQGKLRLRNANL